MILTDNETKVDLLNNEAIAATIIKLLRDRPDRPVTVGVHGDWGAGKSSVLEMIETGFDSEGKVLCLKFNGWRFQGFEDAKIALSAEEQVAMPLAFLEAGLVATATRGDFDRAIAARIDRLHKTATACIRLAGLKPAAIDTIFLTGGSSRVPAVRAAIGRAAPSARLAAPLAGGSDLLSVALGLTEMAGRLA